MKSAVPDDGTSYVYDVAPDGPLDEMLRAPCPSKCNASAIVTIFPASLLVGAEASHEANVPVVSDAAR